MCKVNEWQSNEKLAASSDANANCWHYQTNSVLKIKIWCIIFLNVLQGNNVAKNKKIVL